MIVTSFVIDTVRSVRHDEILPGSNLTHCKNFPAVLEWLSNPFKDGQKFKQTCLQPILALKRLFGSGRAALTASTSMFIGLKASQQGDIVCLLDGGQHYFVLRSEERYFRFIGQCIRVPCDRCKRRKDCERQMAEARHQEFLSI